MISASAGKFTPRSIFDDAFGRPDVVGDCAGAVEGFELVTFAVAKIPVVTAITLENPTSSPRRTWTREDFQRLEIFAAVVSNDWKNWMSWLECMVISPRLSPQAEQVEKVVSQL